ncbi:MAG: hypothetical protein C4303_09785, partial [candidate division GAL15 bacterium]
MRAARRVLALVRKDLVLEWRGRDVLVPAGAFGLAVLLVLGLVSGGGPQDAPTLLWVSVLLASVLAAGRSAEREGEEGTLEVLLLYPGSREDLFWGRHLALCVLLLPTAARAQAVYGNIVGTVTDPSGAAVPNAKVTITDTGRNVSFTATTNESGVFNQRFLIVGRYQVRVEAAGFRAFVQEVGVSVDQETSLNIGLQIGDVNQVVEVTSEAPVLKTERSDVAVTFSEKTLTNLPIPGRRFTQIEIFTPGVTAFPGQTAASEDPQGSFRK